MTGSNQINENIEEYTVIAFVAISCLVEEQIEWLFYFLRNEACGTSTGNAGRILFSSKYGVARPADASFTSSRKRRLCQAIASMHL